MQANQSSTDKPAGADPQATGPDIDSTTTLSAPANEVENPAPTVAPTPPASNSDPAPTPPAATPDPVSVPPVTTPDPVVAASSQESRVKVKRRGQFMDVMHTSSDMKQADPAPKLAPRRETVTLRPTVERPTQSTPAVAEPVKRPAPEMVRQQPVIAPAQPATTTSSQTEVAESTSNTPFLADAKVDKRPLGGLQPSNMVETAPPVSDPDMTQSEAAENDDPTILPEELQQDVLAVEADTSNTPETSSPSDSQAPDPAATTKSANVTATAPATMTNVGSLPQSPPAKPVDDSHEVDSSIFDTEKYQAPIKHPVKRKRGWPVVVAISVLLLLGAGGGIAFYLLSNGY